LSKSVTVDLFRPFVLAVKEKVVELTNEKFDGVSALCAELCRENMFGGAGEQDLAEGPLRDFEDFHFLRLEI
jgi:hypothetical protein